MKKLIFATLLTGLMSTSNVMAEWVDGTINAVVKYPTSTNIWVEKADSTIVKAVLSQTGDSKKEFMALALTAYSQKTNVSLYKAPAGWTGIILK